MTPAELRARFTNQSVQSNVNGKIAALRARFIAVASIR
jgi:hypothetical protein